MQKTILLYSLSVGINRGAFLILMPFLLGVLSNEGIGYFSYAQILIQLFAPLLSLNIFTAISREGADDSEKGKYIYLKTYLPICVSIVSVTSCLYLLTPNFVETIYLWGLFIGGIEGLHNMQLSYLRSADKNIQFFSFSVAKTIGLLISFFVFHYFTHITDINYYFLIQTIWFVLLYCIFHLLIGYKIDAKYDISIQDAIKFSVSIIPHSIALWVIMGAGRYFIKFYQGIEVLGFFSRYYTLAMTLMILNSGISLVIPQYIIRDFTQWTSGNIKNKLAYRYSLACILLYAFLIGSIYLDYNYLHFFKIDFKAIALEFYFIFSGFYILCFYYIYSNILFALRKTVLLSSLTVVTAITSVLINALLTKYYGTFGASLSVFLVYLFYYFIFLFFCLKYEKGLLKSLREEILIISASLAVLLFLTFMFS
jgi:O-antigen/teichoic acid export membrane protein